MKILDTIPDKTFIGIFQRTTEYVNLKDTMTPDEIDERMKYVEKKMLMMQHKASRDKTSHKWMVMRKHMRILRHNGFGSRTIYEAIMKPQSRIGLTLRYGRKRADEMLLERARKRQSIIRIRRWRQIGKSSRGEI